MFDESCRLAKLECIPCTLSTALKFIKLSVNEEDKRRKIFGKVMEAISKELDEFVPARMANVIFKLIREESGVLDPLKDKRREINRIALEVSRKVEKHVFEAKDKEKRIKRALIAAITGNLIDFGIATHRFNLDKLFEEYLKNLRSGFSINDTPVLIRKLEKAKKVLVIGDNVGEVAFDKILLKELNEFDLRLFYSVRGGPVSGDATFEDAYQVGLNDYAEIISTGLDEIGVDLKRSSDQFKRIFNESHVVIAKGQSNFETLISQISTYFRPTNYVFSVFKVKCPVIASFLKTDVGGNIVKLLGVIN